MSRIGGLRGRITLLVAAAVVLCLGVAFEAVDYETSTELRDRLDQDLRTETDALRRAVVSSASDPADVARRARAYVAAQRFRAQTQLVFVDPQAGAPLTNQPELLGLVHAGGESGETLEDQRREEAAARAILRSPLGFSVAGFPDLGRVRVLVVSDRFAGRTVRLGVAQSLQPVQRAEAVVRRAFVLAGALGLLGAAVGGFLVAARTAAPLRRMAAVAGCVEKGDLRPRMAITGRGDEVQALAHSFDQMLDRLENAFDRQAAFVADASH
ncbi:MAG: HAMP domain-containing protein, partial [Nocardioidaceae bacterium]|nr:HAMP domain-containing protein [Nocardioidaceae bacterium]